MIGFCADCIRSHFEEVWPKIKAVQRSQPEVYGLPVGPPRAADGVSCPLCVHRCRIPEGGAGFCGLRRVESGKLKGGRPHEGNLSYYHDPLLSSFLPPGPSDHVPHACHALQRGCRTCRPAPRAHRECPPVGRGLLSELIPLQD